MTCTAPVGQLTIPTNSTRLGMKGGVHFSFYVLAGSGVVDWAFAFNPPLPGASWWLTNAAGSILASESPDGLAESGSWSLGQDDPHTVWFTTDYALLGVPLGQSVGYQLRGACTSAQPASCTATSCPAGYTCVGGVCVPTSTPPPAPGGSSDDLVLVGLAAAAVGGFWYLNHRSTPAGQARRRRRRGR